jgi:hypothetical protein
MVKGIGPVMAGRLVEMFGLDTLEVIEEAPERLQETEGIGWLHSAAGMRLRLMPGGREATEGEVCAWRSRRGTKAC